MPLNGQLRPALRVLYAHVFDGSWRGNVGRAGTGWRLNRRGPRSLAFRIFSSF
jgi:hypothetical protein